METPKTLQQAIIHFSKPENCNAFMIAARWSDGKPLCPQCGSDNVIYLEKARLFKCRTAHPKQKFSLKVGTIFEDSPLGLDKWLTAIWLIANAKNGISSYEIHRALGITQKTAWFVLHRIRLAMQPGSIEKLSGHIEIDETFIGGKVAVMGLLERHGEVRTMVVRNNKRKSLRPEINAHVEPGSMVYTDSLRSYNDLNYDYMHNVINHAEKYVEGNVHTNGIENFWSLLNRDHRRHVCQ